MKEFRVIASTMGESMKLVSSLAMVIQQSVNNRGSQGLSVADLTKVIPNPPKVDE